VAAITHQTTEIGASNFDSNSGKIIKPAVQNVKIRSNYASVGTTTPYFLTKY